MRISGIMCSGISNTWVLTRKKEVAKTSRCPLLVLLARLLELGIWEVYQAVLRWTEKKKTKKKPPQNRPTVTAQQFSVFHQNPINTEEVFLEFLGTGNFHWPLEKFHHLKVSRVGSGTCFTLFPAHLLSQHNPLYLFIKILSTHSASFLLQRVLGEKQLTFCIPLSLLMLNSIFLPQILGTTYSHFSWHS